jgi:hypothetical protein
MSNIYELSKTYEFKSIKKVIPAVFRLISLNKKLKFISSLNWKFILIPEASILDFSPIFLSWHLNG